MDEQFFLSGFFPRHQLDLAFAKMQKFGEIFTAGFIRSSLNRGRCQFDPEQSSVQANNLVATGSRLNLQ